MDEVVDVDMSPTETSSNDVKESLERWRSQFDKGVLTAACIEEHFRKWVPKIYTPSSSENSLNWSFNEDFGLEVLINPLKEFICNGDPNTVLTQMSQMDKPPSVCGHVFKMGEPTYSCRECGMDKTCVLCVDCFKNSDHRLHKYKMGTSGGGGCCDCGDIEAWKRSPYCKIHLAGFNNENDEKPAGLPEDFKERMRIVFEAVIWYAYQLLSTEDISNNKFKCSSDSDSIFDIDTYCTILYNDEIHTFEQVINTLSKVLKCNPRSAQEFVTNIDREGRAVVKCAGFQHCNELKQEIEKYTSRYNNKPLKVLVIHAHVIAHQIFAMKLLIWLQDFLSHGEGFRAVFSEVVLKPMQGEPCIVKGILLRDSTLWKSTRTQWHRLLISGMLLEYENKKALAKIFTKNYGEVMKGFIKDDHDHSYSISSLSVQLFTVPTLAHILIANDDVLFILMNTFLSECTRNCNKVGKLEFQKASSTTYTFKRALFMLYDLRYLLSSIPERWTDELRKSFLQGFTYILKLLVMMQGMDAVTRQVGQHMEYEPEWEAGFNLHVKLAYCLSLAVEWCGTDRVVLIKAYRLVLKKLEENPCYEPNEAGEVRELADHSTACLPYDVATKPVSIHLPITRIFAALHLYLEKYNLHFDSPEFQGVKPTPVQIIEPVLRAQVMIAQVHAGMWRRNGYALLNTIFFYHNVKCRTEMLDRDISVLQIGASLIESNEFLIHMLNKFDLINWAMTDFEITSLKTNEEELIRQPVNLVEELLHLLITIIGERFMPGVANVTNKDRIKKEIIQHLCIKPLPHSELFKTIPDDLAHETALDDVILELAEFKKPTHGTGKGVYELKKEFHDEYNVFFYHYTREEMSKSEESQRLRRKAAGELECCPPPKLLKLNESFNMLVNLLQCDVMLHIMQTVLVRCANLRARSFSESQLHKVLHLIGYALHEEESKSYPFFKFIENSAKFRIFPLLEELLSCPRVDAHKDLLKWTINKFKQVANYAGNHKEAEPVVEKVDNEKERRAKLAAERRAKIMAQMKTMQNNFLKENAKLFEESNIETTSNRTTSTCENCPMEVTEEQETEQNIALGPRQSARGGIEKTYTCILCQEEQTVTADGRSMVLAAFVQQATVLCQHKNNEVFMDITKHDPLYLHANLGPAPHTSTCGHVMHSDCWRKYFDNIMLREHRRPYRLRNPTSFDVDKQEFLCPLCQCISNTVLPLVPPLSALQESLQTNDLDFEKWYDDIEVVLRNKFKVCHGVFKCDLSICTNSHCAACINAFDGSGLNGAETPECEVQCTLQAHQIFYSTAADKTVGEFIEKNKFLSMFPKSYPIVNISLKEMLELFAQVTYTRGLNVDPHPNDKRLAPMAWKSLAYTVHSIEVLLRYSQKPLLGHLSSRQRDCIENLVRIVGVMGSIWKRSVVINSHALNLLSILIEHENEGPSLLQWDSFGFLVSLTFSLPSLFCKNTPTPAPTGGTLEWHTLRLIFISHIIRILILMDVNKINVMETDESIDEENRPHDELLAILKALGKQKDGLRSDIVWKYVQDTCMPFLRCCVLFYHYLTDVSAPAALQEIGGDTFENICSYLDLPQFPGELLKGQAVQALISRWINHEEVQVYLNGVPLQVIEEPLPINRLIDLPLDYSELINTVSTFTCPNSDEDSRYPTMCLVCGEILCSQSYCCTMEINSSQVGACNFHAHKCGAGVGIFLRVRECEILYLSAPQRGCFVSAPYLDDYGETDQGLRRGNPLRLCPERYAKMQYLWLSHSINEEIARALESNNHHIVATQWNML